MSAHSGAPVYRHAPRIVGRRIHGTMVLVRLGTFEACELNALGGRVWELACARSSEQIVSVLAAESGIPERDVRADVDRFLHELTLERWLEQDRSPPASA